MIYIGIDPAFRKNGFAIAVVDTSDRTVRFKRFKNGFLDFMGWLRYEAPEEAVICIENSNLQKATFNMGGSRAVLAKRSRNVGKNQAASQNTVDACKSFYPESTIEVSPADKGRKWTKEEFRAVLSAEKLTPDLSTYKGTQDETDALQLALIGKKRILFKRASGKVSTKRQD